MPAALSFPALKGKVCRALDQKCRRTYDEARSRPHLEAEMIVKSFTQKKPVAAKRKKASKERTFADVRVAARGGEAAFDFYVENGRLPVSK
jgi:hypothetical protein